MCLQSNSANPDACDAYAYGCLLGLFVGDAAGAPLEFLREKDPVKVEALVQKAMLMSGGGAIRVAPGQFTDDSELAIHLLRGLLGHSPQDGFPTDDVAQQYIAWITSSPFDVGMTCSAAFYGAENAEDMQVTARTRSMGSQANGSLMRIAPLAIWAHARATTVELMTMARQEAQLSHPNVVCQDANAVYCVALAALLNSGRNSGGTVLERAAASIKSVEGVISEMDKTIKQWFNDSATLSLDGIIVNSQIGHLKHAFILAFYFLRRATAFEVAITETCRKLGDSDTNAAIVGAMLGALHGSHGIPTRMSDPVLAFDCASHTPSLTGRGYTRPATYLTRDVMALLPALVGALGPERLVAEMLDHEPVTAASGAYGCLMGLFAGDAAGAPLEFLQETDPVKIEALVQDAMHMLGGGKLNVAPGQLTDDSELAMHLVRGLLGRLPQDGFPVEAVAWEYSAWIKSAPFNRGRTCIAAFKNASSATHMCCKAQKHEDKCIEKEGVGGQANGALMRIAPLAIWAHARVTPSQLMDMARQDACLSHPNKVCQDANAVYCVALASLLTLGPLGSCNVAARAIASLQCVEAVMGEMHETIQQWFKDSATLSLAEIVVSDHICHVKHAFILTFYFLRRAVAFDVAILETCRKLGDSDTNSAIVGAVMGALHGSAAIPRYMSGPLLAFHCASHDPKLTGRGYIRPAAYITADVLALLPTLGGKDGTVSPSSAAYGCLMGLFVGDAAGASLRGLHDPLETEARILQAMRLEGGGSLQTAPGQVTNVSELAIHLLRGLLGRKPNDGFPADPIAREYITWIKSSPFEIGTTSSHAFGSAKDAAGMRKDAQKHSSKSQANGALTRVAPLAIWGHASLTPTQLIQMARQEAALSHPHQVCQDASAVYCNALAALLSSPIDILDVAARSAACIRSVEGVIGEMHADVQQWLMDSAALPLAAMDATNSAGHVKHAFTLAFHFLRCCSSFEVAMIETCRKLGSTDSNCSAVGAMMGALHGRAGVPGHLSKPVLEFNCTTHNPNLTSMGHRRPATYRVWDVMALLPALQASSS